MLHQFIIFPITRILVWRHFRSPDFGTDMASMARKDFTEASKSLRLWRIYFADGGMHFLTGHLTTRNPGRFVLCVVGLWDCNAINRVFFGHIFDYIAIYGYIRDSVIE